MIARNQHTTGTILFCVAPSDIKFAVLIPALIKNITNTSRNIGKDNFFLCMSILHYIPNRGRYIHNNSTRLFGSDGVIQGADTKVKTNKLAMPRNARTANAIMAPQINVRCLISVWASR